MPNHDIITSNAVATLLLDAYHDVCYVQVLVVAEGSSLAGGKKYNISMFIGWNVLLHRRCSTCWRVMLLTSTAL
jgi:hypothetical protein